MLYRCFTCDGNIIVLDRELTRPEQFKVGPVITDLLVVYKGSVGLNHIGKYDGMRVRMMASS